MSTFQIYMPQEIYQPVPFPTAVQQSLNNPQGPVVYAQNWYANSSQTGFTGTQNLQTVLSNSSGMRMVEHTKYDRIFSRT